MPELHRHRLLSPRPSTRDVGPQRSVQRLDVGGDLGVGAGLREGREVVAVVAGAAQGDAEGSGDAVGDRRVGAQLGDRALDGRGVDAVDDARVLGDLGELGKRALLELASSSDPHPPRSRGWRRRGRRGSGPQRRRRRAGCDFFQPCGKGQREAGLRDVLGLRRPAGRLRTAAGGAESLRAALDQGEADDDRERGDRDREPRSRAGPLEAPEALGDRQSRRSRGSRPSAVRRTPPSRRRAGCRRSLRRGPVVGCWQPSQTTRCTAPRGERGREADAGLGAAGAVRAADDAIGLARWRPGKPPLLASRRRGRSSAGEGPACND